MNARADGYAVVGRPGDRPGGPGHRGRSRTASSWYVRSVVDELALASVLLAAIALISCLTVENKRVIRRMPRALWIGAILLVPLAGPIAWFVSGRPLTIRPARTGWRLLRGFREPPRPAAPDDDPNFLRSLGQPTGNSQEDLRRREENVEQPEDEQRRSDPDPDD